VLTFDFICLKVFTLPDQGTLGAETAVPPITITSQVKIQ